MNQARSPAGQIKPSLLLGAGFCVGGLVYGSICMVTAKGFGLVLVNSSVLAPAFVVLGATMVALPGPLPKVDLTEVARHLRVSPFLRSLAVLRWWERIAWALALGIGLLLGIAFRGALLGA